MKSTLTLITLAAATVSQATACPGSASWIHAKCEMEVTFKNSCSSVMTEMNARAAGVNGWADPHNGGTYTLTEKGSNDLEGTRVTGDGKYTDKFDFNFESNGDNACTVTACSESQVNSIIDMSTNYCNLHSLYCNSAEGCPNAGADLTYDETYSSCSQHSAVCVASSVEGIVSSLRGSASTFV